MLFMGVLGKQIWGEGKCEQIKSYKTMLILAGIFDLVLVIILRRKYLTVSVTF